MISFSPSSLSFEDERLEESKLQDFLEKKDRGDVSTLKTHEILVHSRQKAVLPSIQSDGYLRFGDYIQLQNVCSNGGLIFISFLFLYLYVPIR